MATLLRPASRKISRGEEEVVDSAARMVALMNRKEDMMKADSYQKLLMTAGVKGHSICIRLVRSHAKVQQVEAILLDAPLLGSKRKVELSWVRGAQDTTRSDTLPRFSNEITALCSLSM